MKDFEEYLEEEENASWGRDVACNMRVMDRRKTREDRKMGHVASAINVALLVFLVAMVLLFVGSMGVANATPVVEKASPERATTRQEVVELQEEEVEQPENELIEQALLSRATRIDGVTVTHYCICEKCCGKTPDHPAYGITASGLRATPGVTVAVDPDVIPLGSDVLVDYGNGEIHYYRADDTGSAVKGNHIDLCVSSHEEALQLGVRTATVWWVEN